MSTHKSQKLTTTTTTTDKQVEITLWLEMLDLAVKNKLRESGCQDVKLTFHDLHPQEYVDHMFMIVNIFRKSD